MDATISNFICLTFITPFNTINNMINNIDHSAVGDNQNITILFLLFYNLVKPFLNTFIKLYWAFPIWIFFIHSQSIKI